MLKKIIFGLLCCFFFSCSQTDSKIMSTVGSLIFEYENVESLPKVRLSVFTNSNNEAQRADSLEVFCAPDNFTWKINKPELLLENGRNWIGYSKLVLPENKKFRVGRYQIKYTDAKGDESESAFYLNFSPDLYNCKIDEFSKKVNGGTTEKIVLFDKDMNITFYGSAKNTWKTGKNVKFDYSRSEYFRKSVSNISGSLIFLLPIKELKDNDEKPFEY